MERQMSEMTKARKAQMRALEKAESLNNAAQMADRPFAVVSAFKAVLANHREALAHIERLEGEKRPMPAFDSPCPDGTMLCGVCDQSEARGHAPDCPGPDWPNRDIADLKAQLAARNAAYDREYRRSESLAADRYQLRTDVLALEQQVETLTLKVAARDKEVARLTARWEALIVDVREEMNSAVEDPACGAYAGVLSMMEAQR